MNREVHVRLREGLRGKFPRSTRLTTIQEIFEPVLDSRYCRPQLKGRVIVNSAFIPLRWR